MITLKLGKGSFHFGTRLEMRNRSIRPVAAKGFRTRTYWFGTEMYAEAFLGRFSGDRTANGEMAKLIRKPDEPFVFSLPAPKWIPQVAVLLVSGDVVVVEIALSLRTWAQRRRRWKSR